MNSFVFAFLMFLLCGFIGLFTIAALHTGKTAMDKYEDGSFRWFSAFIFLLIIGSLGFMLLAFVDGVTCLFA